MSLTSITISENITRIPMGTFEKCSSLTSITIPQGVTGINNQGFYLCNSLTNINIRKEEGSITGAPWGAYGATINWNYTGK